MKYVLIASLALVAAAQESIHYASVGGRVTDPSGRVVEGAQVRARQVDTNVTSTMTTDNEGRFRFAYLSVGTWEITVEQPGVRGGDAQADRGRGRRIRLAGETCPGRRLHRGNGH